jgi:brefeldin A-inhibited guanine nucleotide-exchange protein
MTLEDFAKMLKGINSGGNLNEGFIRKIYEHVERDPFTLNEDDDARIKAEAAHANSLKRKQDLFQKEGQGLVQRGKQMISQKSNNNFVTIEDCKAIKPLFENTWTPNLVTFSRILEETPDDEIAAICIEGFVHSIKICGYYNMVTERAAFVSSLAKFTQVSSERRIKSKHIMVIQKIIELATL